MKTHRQIVKAIDIQIYFGKSQSMSNKMLRSIRRALHKEKYQPITITEFCGYYKIETEPLIKVIVANDVSALPIDSGIVENQALQNINMPTKAQEPTPYQFQSKPWQKQAP